MEKRRKKRVPKRFSVKFGEEDLLYSGLILNISASGAFVSANRLPPVGMRLHLQIKYGRNFAYLEARVCRHRVVPPALKQIESGGFAVVFVTPIEIFEELVPEQSSNPDALAVRFESGAVFHACWEKELRFGGLLVRTDRRLSRDDTVAVVLGLVFAGQQLEFKARVVQVVPGGVAVSFETPAAVKTALQPFVGPSSINL